MTYAQNNLAFASSPYLQQHANSPIWWQEWDKSLLEYATRSDKIVFASIGYATCHWCHVMAQEAFSDERIAEYLNSNFISIKVDREQRPDIDQFAMAFITSLGERGGWPLNIFLTPSLRPIFACTYIPVGTRDEAPGFLDVLREIKNYYDTRKDGIEPFVYKRPRFTKAAEERF